MGDEPVRCARSAAFPRSPWTAITAPGRSRCSGSPVTPRSKRYVSLTVSLGSCRPARYMRTGSRARRSQACCPWPGSSTGTTGSRSTVNQVCPASLPPAMRGLVPIRRRAGGLRPGWCTPHCLRSVVRAHFDDLAELAQMWHQHTEQRVAPFCWNQVAADCSNADSEARPPSVTPPAQRLNRWRHVVTRAPSGAPITGAVSNFD